MAACSSLPSIGPRTANGLPTHVDGGAGQILRFCEKMHDARDLTTAAAACERAHRLDPGAPEPLLELASILGEMDEPDLSIAAYRAVLKTSPVNADAHYGLGRTYLDQGQSDLALAEFRAALKSSPRDPRLYSAVGVASGLLGDHAEAQDVFRDGLLVAPQDIALRNNLGLSLVQSGRYDQGLLVLEAVAKDSNAGQASRDNLLMAQGLAATARAEIMLAEAQAEAEAEALAQAEALARAEALETAMPEDQDQDQALAQAQDQDQSQPKNSSEAAEVALAPEALDSSDPQGSSPMDGPEGSGVAPVGKLATKPVPNKARQAMIARALTGRPEPKPRPLTAPTALTKAMAPPPASPTAITPPEAQPAKTRTQTVWVPRSRTSPKGRQTARADFGGTSDAGAVMNNAPEVTASSRTRQQTMPEMPSPNRLAATPRQPRIASSAKPVRDSYTVQFASFTSEERAWRGWDSVRGTASGLLNDIKPDVRRADLGGDMGTVYRLRTQPAPKQTAKTLCSALKAKGVDCLVLRSKPEMADSSASSGPTTL